MGTSEDLMELSVDEISRLIIREDIDGEKFAIRFEQSELMTGDGERPVNMRCELENEDILDFFEAEAAGVLRRYEVEALELDCVSVPRSADYHFPSSIIVLTGAMATKQGSSYFIDPAQLPVMSGYFGTVCVPQYNPPTALLLALQKRQKGTANQLLKRIRDFPSAYGVANFRPKYYASLGRLTSPEERSKRWPI